MFTLFSAVVRLLSLAPSRLLLWLSYPLSWLTWWASSTKRNSTRVNLAACYPGLDERARETLGRESMRHYVLLALETGVAWYWSRARLEAHYQAPVGAAHLDAAMSHGHGVLFIVPHLGNWELLQLWLNERIAVASLYKPGRYPEFEAKLRRKRQRFGGEMAPTNRAGIRLLVQFLKSARGVLILPDQDPSEGQGQFVRFFGVPTYTPVLASRICRQTGCRALVATCLRTRGGRFQVHFEPVPEAFYGDDLESSLAAMNRAIEACIAIDPPQYLWAYKRFKTRPDGEPRFYRPYAEVRDELLGSSGPSD